jgi:hypothetical protein
MFVGGKPMRWFRIRKANIDSGRRAIFEQYGIVTMQLILGTTNYLVINDEGVRAENLRPQLLPWLTEQYDRAERKDTWSVTMEFVITIFVVLEVVHFRTIVSWMVAKL